MTKVLCVEDDEFFAREIVSALSASGIVVKHVISASDALKSLSKESFDLITLDRMLPDLDGMELLRRIKRMDPIVPVIMISGMNTIEDRVAGISAGCRDYIIKPFSSDEVVARILVHLRYNVSGQDTTYLTVDETRLHLIEKTLHFGFTALTLKNVEFRLMQLMMKNHDILITRQMILESVWGYTFDPGTKVIDVHINALRKKLECLGTPLQIINLRGTGFILRKPENHE